ncbi:MAG: hypothetical protein ACXQTV_04685, partial [Candidatus Hecatellaceae archaeon]
SRLVETFLKQFKGDKPPLIALLIHTSYDEDYDKALKAARRWAPVLLPNLFKDEIFDPREIEARGSREVRDELLASTYLIAVNPEALIRRIEEAGRQGFNCVFISNTSPNPRRLLEVFGREVIPYFKSSEK